LVKT